MDQRYFENLLSNVNSAKIQSQYIRNYAFPRLDHRHKFWKSQKLQLGELVDKLNYFRLVFICLKFIFIQSISTLRKLKNGSIQLE